jgi:diacylglycerol kinase family enzyme
VAIVSGDGLMHEYVNSFCPLPVTHVPAGSGNAFAKTQMEEAGELCKDEESIYLVIKNRTR